MARLFELPETKGNFQIRAKVTGTEKDNFYTEGKTRTGKEKRAINFGANYDKDSTIYLGFNAYPKTDVYFSGGKGVKAVKVPWANRMTFEKDGFSIIGIGLGLEKEIDEKGQKVNKKVNLVEFDAAKYIREHLEDDDSVFLKGSLTYNSWTTDDGSKARRVNLEPNQISLCKPIDFDAEDFEAMAVFNQVFVFTEIEKEEVDGKQTGRALISGYVVTYNSIEPVQFITEDKGIAANFAKKIKPYSSIKVWGKIVCKTESDEVETDDDTWGETDPTKRVTRSYTREFIITGADGGSIDKETYTKAEIEDALEKIRQNEVANNDFGDKTDSSDDDWGSSDPTSSDDDDLDW